MKSIAIFSVAIGALALSGCGTSASADMYGLSADTRSMIDSGIEQMVASGSCEKHRPTAASALVSGVLYVLPGLDEQLVDAYALDSLERQCAD